MAVASPHTVAELRERGRRGLATAADILARIEGTAAPFTQRSILEPLNDILIELANVSLEVSLLKQVHPSLAVREACEELEREASRFGVRLNQSRPLYDALGEIDSAPLDAQGRRVIDLVRMDMRRAGAALGDADRERAQRLRDDLVRLAQDYARNIRDDVRTVEAEPSELEGLPADYRAGHAPGPDGKVRITTDPPDTGPVLAYAKSAGLRRRVAQVLGDRAPGNLAVFAELRAKRHELARLLGYSSWADYVVEDKMAASTENVRRFLGDVRAAAAPAAEAEFAELLRAKRADFPDARSLSTWESDYYTQRVRAERYAFDAREARPYFEYRRVRQAILDLNSELFGLTFRPVSEEESWHPAVETFEVSVDGDVRGRISLDMHPREGKNKWFFCTTKRPGVPGRQQYHGVLVCNFPDPTAQAGPALMDHFQVVIFFHEFGHLVHGIAASKTKWLRLVRPEGDFMEAPSRFLEDWIYDHEVLLRFAAHVETGEAIPVALVERLRAAREFGRALVAENGTFQSTLALRLHDGDPQGTDARAIAAQTRRELSRVEALPQTNYPVNWEHMSADLYSAGYYTYVWSDVLARDLHSAFTGGLLDLTRTRRYRDLVIGRGGTLPAAELVRDFLGRPYGFDSYRSWLAPRAAEGSG